MLGFLAHLVLSAALLLLVASLVRGVRIDDWTSAVLVALVLGIVNGLVRPLVVLLTLPLTIVTFGLFLFVINAFMLQLSAAVVPGVRVEGCGSALVGSLLLSLLNVAVAMLIG